MTGIFTSKSKLDKILTRLAFCQNFFLKSGGHTFDYTERENGGGGKFCSRSVGDQNGV